MKTALLLLALASSAVPASAVPASAGPTPAGPAFGSDDELVERIEMWVGPFVEAGELSGTLLVARGDQILFEHAYGWASRELEVPNRVDTLHNVASITKPMTIAIAARLIEAGKLGVGDTLDEWIEGFPNGDRITVSHLLNHTAGIPHRVTRHEDEVTPRTAADMVEFARRAELLSEPGAQSVYSSAGYSVLARVLELASGEPYEVLLEEHVCKPAGLESTLHTNQRVILPGRARDYLPAIGGVRHARLQDFSFLVGAGSVYSTARDLFRLARAKVGAKFGPAAHIALNGAARRWSWNGATGGFRAFVDYDGTSDVTIVFAGNLASGANDLVRAAMPGIVAGESSFPPQVPSRAVHPLSAEELASFEGRYQSRPGRSMSVRAIEGGLLIEDWVLIPTGPTSFFSPQDYGVVEAERDADGRVTSLRWGASVMPRVGDLGAD